MARESHIRTLGRILDGPKNTNTHPRAILHGQRETYMHPGRYHTFRGTYTHLRVYIICPRETHTLPRVISNGHEGETYITKGDITLNGEDTHEP